MTEALSATPPSLDDLLSEEAVQDPTSFYNHLREIDPVYWNSRWNGWIVTGYDDVIGGFRDFARLSNDRFKGPFAKDMQAASSRYEQLIEFMGYWLFTKDRPYHTHLRSLVNTAFTPRAVERVRPRVQELVVELTDRLRGRDSANFMAEFAFTLPVVVISEFLGIPPESREHLHEWSEAIGEVVFQGGNQDRFDKGGQAMEELANLMRPIVRARQKDPQDDLISGMVHAEVDGDTFLEDEIIANVVLMVFAGHETTMNLIANGVVAFDRFPDQWARLQGDPAVARVAVEEVLRWDGPIRALARWAKEPFELGGKQIRENDRVLLVQHGANHDPAAYERADQFDIGRWPNKHLAFGQGIHTCLGAPLARLEAQEAFTHLSREFASIEVLTEELRYAPNLVNRSLTNLEVKVHEK